MKHLSTRAGAAACALAAALLLAGCGSSSDSGAADAAPPDAASSATPSASPSASSSTPASPSESAGASEAPAPAAVITIKDYEYDVPASVKAGESVMIKNEDTVAHTVTADDKGGFDVNVPANGTAMLKAPAAGSYAFHCTYHSDMKATLKVG